MDLCAVIYLDFWFVFGNKNSIFCLFQSVDDNYGSLVGIIEEDRDT